MIGRLAGFFSILAGALVAVGAFPTWVTISTSAGATSGYNAFNIVGDYRDAIVSFALAAVLLLAGFVLTARPLLLSRMLGALAGMGAALWAALLFFSLAPQAHDLIAPKVPAPTTTIDIGLWVMAGGGLLGLLAALVAAVARPRRVVATPVPAAAAPAAPVAARAGAGRQHEPATAGSAPPPRRSLV